LKEAAKAGAFGHEEDYRRFAEFGLNPLEGKSRLIEFVGTAAQVFAEGV
jgi:hypothetical protein